jgi:type IV pilus assembly protein PilV
MIEVLMTIVILSFGLLGLAALQGKAHTAEMESYQRGQALALMKDMANRMENNFTNAASYVTTGALGTGATDATDCSAEATLVLRDRCEWSKALKGASEANAGAAQGAMVDGRGCITSTGTRQYQISVVWQAMSEGVDQSWVTCGNGSYTPPRSRRAMTTVVLIPDLAAP